MGIRVLPIFAELRPYLEDAQQLAGDSSYIINRSRDTNTNWRTTFTKIVGRAGLKPWPKLFHNLRASRQTELQENFPAHVVCNWLGNSEAVAMKHYLQTTDDHFTAATRPVQNAVNSMPEMDGKRLQDASTQNDKTPVLQGSAAHFRSDVNVSVGREGLLLWPMFRTAK